MPPRPDVCPACQAKQVFTGLLNKAQVLAGVCESVVQACPSCLTIAAYAPVRDSRSRIRPPAREVVAGGAETARFLERVRAAIDCGELAGFLDACREAERWKLRVPQVVEAVREHFRGGATLVRETRAVRAAVRFFDGETSSDLPIDGFPRRDWVGPFALHQTAERRVPIFTIPRGWRFLPPDGPIPDYYELNARSTGIVLRTPEVPDLFSFAPDLLRAASP